MELAYLIVSAAIGLPDNTWFSREFNLGFISEEEEFDRLAAEAKVCRVLEDEGFEYTFVAIIFYEELWDCDSDDESVEAGDS
jgi:hypothetical protein